jgi:hypothetical protein
VDIEYLELVLPDFFLLSSQSSCSTLTSNKESDYVGKHDSERV